MRGMEYLTSGLQDGSIVYHEDHEQGFGFKPGAAIETTIAGELVRLGVTMPSDNFSTHVAQAKLAQFLDAQREDMGDLAPWSPKE